MQLVVATAGGTVRARNEDHVLALDSVLNDGALHAGHQECAQREARFGGIWVAVADGVGGAPAGDVASGMTLSLVRDAFEAGVPGLAATGERAFLEQVLPRVNEQVREAGVADAARRGMSSTLTGALIRQERVTLFHAGDSRAYLWAGGELRMLTRDHAVMGMIAQAAGMSLEEAVESGGASIANCMGKKDFYVDVVETGALTAGARLLLCTDGIFGVVPRRRLAELLGADETPPLALAQRLIDVAIAAKSQDNMSVAIIDATRR